MSMIIQRHNVRCPLSFYAERRILTTLWTPPRDVMSGWYDITIEQTVCVKRQYLHLDLLNTNIIQSCFKINLH